MIDIAYYVTGHGLGHATRSLELIAALLKTKMFRISSISNVPEAFFLQELNNLGIDTCDDAGNIYFEHSKRNLDTGGIQLDAIRMDVKATLSRYLDTIHLHRQKLIDDEVAWLKSKNIKLALFDATPIASAAARLAGVKAVFVTNFTWDFVFREMLLMVESNHADSADPGILSSYQSMIETCAEDVSSCDLIIHYPGATPLPSHFRSDKIVPGPLIARPVRNPDIKASFIRDGEKLLLLGFGGHAVDWKLEDSFLPQGWRCIVLRANPKLMPSDRFTVAPDDAYIPDLIYASDVVLGKIGYGFVSECLTCLTPLVYVPRVSWPEEKYLEQLLVKEYDAGVAIPLEEYESGNWTGYLEKAVEKKGRWVLPRYFNEEQQEVTATEKVVTIVQTICDGTSSV